MKSLFVFGVIAICIILVALAKIEINPCGEGHHGVRKPNGIHVCEVGGNL